MNLFILEDIAKKTLFEAYGAVFWSVSGRKEPKQPKRVQVEHYTTSCL